MSLRRDTTKKTREHGTWRFTVVGNGLHQTYPPATSLRTRTTARRRFDFLPSCTSYQLLHSLVQYNAFLLSGVATASALRLVTAKPVNYNLSFVLGALLERGMEVASTKGRCFPPLHCFIQPTSCWRHFFRAGRGDVKCLLSALQHTHLFAVHCTYLYHRGKSEKTSKKAIDFTHTTISHHRSFRLSLLCLPFRFPDTAPSPDKHLLDDRPTRQQQEQESTPTDHLATLVAAATIPHGPAPAPAIYQ